MVQVYGVDGCRAGWIAVSTTMVNSRFRWRVVSKLAELLADPSPPAVIAVDVPIGLPDVGARPCDLEARQLLGPGRASSVFPAPIRPVLAASCHTEASAARRAAEGKGLSIQAWAIVPKIREIDEALRADPDLRSRVREVHPELCFYFMAGGRPMKFAKKKAPGHAERLELLRMRFGHVIDEALSEMRGKGCGADDVLDAFVALWTAQRIMAGEAVTLPAHPGHDRFGLPMEMIA